MSSLLPYNTRIPGVINDGKIASMIKTEPLPIQNITVPTLAISAKDDLWKTYRAAKYTANNIPNAQFLGFDTGGHLLNGHEDKVRSHVATFLRQYC